MTGQGRSGRAVTAEALVAATVAQDEGHDLPARFALEPRPEQDPMAVAAAVAAELEAFHPRVEPLSVLEPRLLVLELPERTFAGAGAAQAFAAAYALADHFDLRAAEPDLPTALFPEQPRAARGPAEEGLFDGFLAGCWAPPEPALDALWALRAMRVPEAWAFSEQMGRRSRGEGIVVAQPDTGITAHPELADARSVPGVNIMTGAPDPTDPLGGGFGSNPGHGTGTASVLVSPPTLMVTGSAPLASHMAIRAIDSVIRVSQVEVARAIDWAVDHGAHVITMSLGGIPAFSLFNALTRAVAADVIVLAAAGNCIGTVVWPARYDECIAVAGVDAADAPWRGSCRGPAVDVSAPGQNVLRAAPRTETGQGQGTSFAVALTAGVAALWLAHHGRANVIAEARARGETVQAMFRRMLGASSRRPGAWNAFEMGPGIVDARGLLAASFDVGRDRESVEPPVDPLAREAWSVETLVAETVGPAAVPDEGLDWHRYGAEIATVLLQEQLVPQPDEGVRAETPAPEVTAELAGVVGNPVLRDRLGFDSDLAPEVGIPGGVR